MPTSLLDTHTLIWWWLQDPSLSDTARNVMTDTNATVVVSAVSAFEIGQKARVGRLPALRPIVADLFGALRADRFAALPLNAVQALRAGLTPGTHRDPFDRLIAFQAQDEGFTVITRDRKIASFGCKTLW